MKQYIKTLGGVIERQTARDPVSARRLLTAAYSWVHFSGSRRGGRTVRTAYDRLNGAVAGSIVDTFRKPQEAVMVNLFFPCELLHALDIQPMFPEGISVYVACTACQHVFAEAAEAADVPESYCSYHKTLLGMAGSGVMPAPGMIVSTTLACDANQLTFRGLADYYQAPHTVIDVPHSTGEDAVAYVADQLRALVPQLESVAGKRLDEEKLRETVARSQRTLETYRKFLARRGEVSLPTTMTGELCSMIATHVMLGREESEDYMERLLEASQLAPALDPTKQRLFWMHTLPNWQDSMKDILESGERVELVGSDTSVDFAGDLDPNKPFESMARRVVETSYNGAGSRRVETALRAAREAKADGVVVFCHWGCKQTLGLSQLAKQTLEAEGLPTLVLDGDGCDARNVADGQMVTRLNAFIEQLEGLS